MESRKGKREYTLVDYDDEQLCTSAPRGVFSVTELHNDAAAATQETTPMPIPRVRRIRVGVEIAAPASVPLVALSSSSSSALSPAVPTPRDAVVPGLDYGPCRICGTPLGDQPFVPYQLMAKFCAVSQAAGMGILTQLEHDSVVTRLEEVDHNADVLFSIYLPHRVPYQCECSERCYILYRTACDGPLAIVQRVLAALGCDYRNVELNDAERAGVERLRGYVSAGFANMCSPAELGLVHDSDVEMSTNLGPYVEEVDDNALSWQYNPAAGGGGVSSAASAPPMPGQYEAPMASTSLFWYPPAVSYEQ